MRVLKFVLLFFVVFFVLGISLASRYYFLIPKLQQDVAILILGKGGEGHTAPDLTDTIMIAFLDKDSKKVGFLSLPRDIWIPEIRAKLNTAYHYGGFEMTTTSVKSIVGKDIDNVVVIDFSLFKDLINSLGGINVEIENAFVDKKYPIAGKENDLCGGDKLYACRYETLEFKKGLQNMDGEMALKFVRSRNAVGDEGTDIAREKRQQKVIEAVKNKVLSKEVLLNPSAIKDLYQVTSDHIETNINVNDIPTLIKFIYESRNNINFLTFPENLIKVSQNDRRYDKQYVFIPVNGSWDKFKEWLLGNL